MILENNLGKKEAKKKSVKIPKIEAIKILGNFK